jgi:hypothetical protein
MKVRRTLFALLLLCPALTAQDFYDVDTLRTVDITFSQTDWWSQLQQNWSSQTNIPADLTVDGVVYPDVGVRIRGNTSYLLLPAGSQKVSLNITVDDNNPGQEVMGYDSLNFNNAFSDPTFCREVVYHNILTRYIPSGRANHIVLTINGQNWGVYANIQQFDKEMLDDYFDEADGMRVKCANNPSGPGLQYVGPNPAMYGGYEIKSDGGLADPMAELIAVCFAVDQTPPASWATADQIFAIDPSIWTTVLENLISDDDSYVNKGCDFVMYRNPQDGRTRLLQTDGNESWTEENWQPDKNFSSSSKPFLSNLLSEPTLRARYFAHMRTALVELDLAAVTAEFQARMNLIDAAVQADPKKLYTYQDFLDNLTMSVSTGGGPFGGSTIGILEYVNQRMALLTADAELMSPAPVVQNVITSTDLPGVPVYVTASISGIDPIAYVDLYYQPTTAGPYQSVPMADDGLSGDGAAGDGVWGAQLPVVGVGGQKVAYYVAATAQNAFMAMTFEPALTENDPAILTFQGGTAPSSVVINEFLAQNNSVVQDPSGSFEDYIELYNTSASSVDLSGMYMSDSLSTPTEWQIPAGTSIAPGGTLLIWADEDLLEAGLHADFKLSASGEEIGLWDATGTTLLDSVAFGQQQADVSTGRLEDGGALQVTFSAPTPDALNDGGCGLRAYDQLDPAAHTLGLTASGTGSLGSVVTFTASGFLPGGPVLFAVDLAPAHLTTTIPGLVLLTGTTSVLTLTADGTGSLVLPAAIPSSGTLIGLDVYCQTAGTDVLGNFAGSNAIHLDVCP